MLKIFRRIILSLQAPSPGKESYTMSREMRERFRSPGVNTDGTPMVGRHDIHGRGYGSSRGFGSSKY